MASAHSTRRSVVPRLMATVRQLTPAELREFKRRFADWQQASGEEAALVDVCRSRLPAADERRLNTLISKSERDALRPPELQEYRRLVRRAEKLDATRLAALTQLASRWGQPVPHVMQIVGWEGGDEEATRHPAGLAKARPRSGR